MALYSAESFHCKQCSSLFSYLVTTIWEYNCWPLKHNFVCLLACTLFLSEETIICNPLPFEAFEKYPNICVLFAASDQ